MYNQRASDGELGVRPQLGAVEFLLVDGGMIPPENLDEPPAMAPLSLWLTSPTTSLS
jgi:hypothetical protein